GRVVLPINEPDIASLSLLSETDGGALAAAAAQAAASAPAVSADAVCQSIGPFESSEALRLAMDALLPKVERIQYREVQAMALHGYRVYLPAASDRAEALATARTLSERGIKDYYVVTAGDQINTVSLGIFRELDNATKRRDAVSALGYNAVVEPRTEPVRQWWVDLAAAPGFNWRRVLPAATLKAVAAPCT
ncbi:MAG: SPOR domain-containing protein, partial [Arenimonas sp.]